MNTALCQRLLVRCGRRTLHLRRRLLLHQLDGGPLLDVVIAQSRAILHALFGGQKTLLLLRDGGPLLYERLHLVDGVGGLHVQSDEPGIRFGLAHVNLNLLPNHEGRHDELVPLHLAQFVVQLDANRPPIGPLVADVDHAAVLHPFARRRTWHVILGGLPHTDEARGQGLAPQHGRVQPLHVGNSHALHCRAFLRLRIHRDVHIHHRRRLPTSLKSAVDVDRVVLFETASDPHRLDIFFARLFVAGLGVALRLDVQHTVVLQRDAVAEKCRCLGRLAADVAPNPSSFLATARVNEHLHRLVLDQGLAHLVHGHAVAHLVGVLHLECVRHALPALGRGHDGGEVDASRDPHAHRVRKVLHSLAALEDPAPVRDHFAPCGHVGGVAAAVAVAVAHHALVLRCGLASHNRSTSNGGAVLPVQIAVIFAREPLRNIFSELPMHRRLASFLLLDRVLRSHTRLVFHRKLHRTNGCAPPTTYVEAPTATQATTANQE
mmetsp:Transcript_100464/g.288666  ORF Transcript_100464/g.288666 Transcript_100464/m.288666 type:complete len:491 (+) Transcript_100464:683-2155(+)